MDKPGDGEGGLSFEALDTLLDQALSLQGEEQQAFIDALDDSQREAVLKLLDRSTSSSLDSFGESSRNRLRTVAEDTAAAEQAAGDWQLLREIGSGGTGQVFYAERSEQRESGEAGEP